jgi:hypothetical protein
MSLCKREFWAIANSEIGSQPTDSIAANMCDACTIDDQCWQPSHGAGFEEIQV